MTNGLYNALIALFISAAIISCGNNSKEATSATPAANPYSVLILGSWNLLYSAEDANANGRPDEDEKFFAPNDERVIIYFQSDGTGNITSTYMDPGGPTVEKNDIAWKLYNDKELELVSIHTSNLGSQVTTVYDTTIVYISHMTEKAAFWELTTMYYSNNDTTYSSSWMEFEKI